MVVKKRKIKVENIQIDQSGKIEQTSLDTIIALSNHDKYSITLSKRSKRLLQEIFRDLKKPRVFVYHTFSALIALVLLKTKPTKTVL